MLWSCIYPSIGPQPVELWTGKQLFSVLIRPHAQMRVFVNLTVAKKSY
ncbi:hypothetical protein C5167_048826 [Papaver somniferum]|uniref:DNA-directed RNA polymerase n=1 Tax=Papaver somniferum TaxID=3469 RepID=A0A4Y7KLX4_PAPSO|nr:hypothetical protein C5167_048826 [Papaver somniferum]